VTRGRTSGGGECDVRDAPRTGRGRRAADAAPRLAGDDVCSGIRGDGARHPLRTATESADSRGLAVEQFPDGMSSLRSRTAAPPRAPFSSRILSETRCVCLMSRMKLRHSPCPCQRVCMDEKHLPAALLSICVQKYACYSTRKHGMSTPQVPLVPDRLSRRAAPVAVGPGVVAPSCGAAGSCAGRLPGRADGARRRNGRARLRRCARRRGPRPGGWASSRVPRRPAVRPGRPCTKAAGWGVR